jgi:hypothetical protein
LVGACDSCGLDLGFGESVILGEHIAGDGRDGRFGSCGGGARGYFDVKYAIGCCCVEPDFLGVDLQGDDEGW